MSMKELLLGKAEKKSWQNLMTVSSNMMDSQVWKTHFSKAFNPLRLQPQDQVEIHCLPKKAFTAETVLWFKPSDGTPDSVRYGIRDPKSQELKLLEVVTDGYNRPVYSIFELVDEFEWDEDLVKVLEDQDELQQSVVGPDGEKEMLVYFKDFVTKANVRVFDQEKISQYDVTVYNYFFESDSGHEHYLTVELFEAQQWITFYQGIRVFEKDFDALGTWLSH